MNNDNIQPQKDVSLNDEGKTTPPPQDFIDALRFDVALRKALAEAHVREPADEMQVSKVWWDGEKLMAKPIPLEGIYKPAQQDDNDFPLGKACDLSGEGTCEACQ